MTVCFFGGGSTECKMQCGLGAKTKKIIFDEVLINKLIYHGNIKSEIP